MHTALAEDWSPSPESLAYSFLWLIASFNASPGTSDASALLGPLLILTQTYMDTNKIK